MAKVGNFSTKRFQISKANQLMIIAIAAASFLVVFMLVAGRALLNERAYNNRVIKEKTAAVEQLQSNKEAAEQLRTSYTEFVSRQENVIGGSVTGTGDKDGDNAKIILNALPSQYDFPALTASLEKILKSGQGLASIKGTDDEVNQQNTASPSPSPVEIPFEITVNGNYASFKKLLDTLQKSIRPFQIQTITLTGSDNVLQSSISVKTFYQPAKDLNVEKKEIK